MGKDKSAEMIPETSESGDIEQDDRGHVNVSFLEGISMGLRFILFNFFFARIVQVTFIYLNYYYYCLNFLSNHMACGLLVPQPGIKSAPLCSGSAKS